RYSRHTVLPEIGERGQKLLSSAEVTIIGLGGLGTVISDALVRCGVGTVNIVDRDVVEISNLQRQTLYDEKDIGDKKADAAYHRLKSINSDVDIQKYILNVGPSNIEDLIEKADIVLDATDNIDTRYVINEACVKQYVPWIFTSVMGTYGMTLNIFPRKGPCLRCLLPDEPHSESFQNGSEAGILFTLPRVMGNISATEAVKYLVGDEPREELLTVDLWKNDYMLTSVARNENCVCCVKEDFEYIK
ncbi:MAG: HesA/MoeB/ThiF family protein, partial [Thermoplasmata archaeon]